MAQKNYTYGPVGISPAYLTQVPGTGSILVPSALPPMTVLWDEEYKQDLDVAMAAQNWAYLYEGIAPTAKVLAQTVAEYLSGDAAFVATADGWVTKVSASLTTTGGTTAGVIVTAIGDTSNTLTPLASARLRVSGGTYSNTVVGAVRYDIPFAPYGSAGFTVPVPLANAATYTFDLQFSVTGVSATITPRKGSGMSIAEHR